MAALGIHVGGYLHVGAATLGLSAVFRHVPEAYLALKLAGAAYLIYLGLGMLFRKPDQKALPNFAAKSARPSSNRPAMLRPGSRPRMRLAGTSASASSVWSLISVTTGAPTLR